MKYTHKKDIENPNTVNFKTETTTHTKYERVQNGIKRMLLDQCE